MRNRILLVEDNPVHRALTKAFFEQRGYVISILQNGLNFFPRITNFQPDVIILDLNLPKVNGFTLLEQLQGSEWNGIPVIVVSAHGFDMEKQRAMALGVRHYLTKPASFNTLAQAIEAEIMLSDS